jgi:hypothetical protein
MCFYILEKRPNFLPFWKMQKGVFLGIFEKLPGKKNGSL